MTKFDLDLTQSHFVKSRGDLTIYGSWFGDGLDPCLVILPTYRQGVPLVVPLRSAYQWNPDDRAVSPAASARMVMAFLSANGMDFANAITHQRVVSLIHDHLDDLISMPLKPSEAVVVADAFRTDTETGRTTHQEIIQRV